MKKLLIVDDEEDILEVLEIVIGSEFEVEAVLVQDGSDAINQIESGEHFDLIICDMNMLKVNGPEVFKMNVKTRKIPFILLSAEAAEGRAVLNSVLDECSSSMEFNTVNKPWNEDELFGAIKSALKV